MLASARRHALLRAIAGAAFMTLAGSSAGAGSTWDGLKGEVFGQRNILPGTGIVRLKAPTRPEDQRAVPVEVEAQLGDGRFVKSVTVIVDENPSPVAAVFHFAQPRDQVHIGAKFRFNSETDTRAIVEASDGQLYMVAQHVKFAGGQAACSAPPAGDPAEIAASMGRMHLAEPAEKPATAATQISHHVQLTVSHPNHSGMVLDQQTLLYVPLKMLSHVSVKLGDEPVVDIAGSITLAQNPSFEFDYRVNGAEKIVVEAEDSDGARWSQSFPIGQGS